jgi:hypothetical protein
MTLMSMQLLNTICCLTINKYILRGILQTQQSFRLRHAYAFAKELTYELTANETDYVYEKLPVIRLSSKVSLELYGRIRGTKIYK